MGNLLLGDIEILLSRDYPAAVGNDLIQYPGNIEKAPRQPNIVQHGIIGDLLPRNGVDPLGQLVQIHFRPLHGFQFCHNSPLLVMFLA